MTRKIAKSNNRKLYLKVRINFKVKITKSIIIKRTIGTQSIQAADISQIRWITGIEVLILKNQRET